VAVPRSAVPKTTTATRGGRRSPQSNGPKPAVGSGTTAKGGERRDQIVRAAAETFYRKGYDATTTQDIAEAVGMLKGSLYYYISAKEDLLYETINEVHEVCATNLERHAVMDGDPLTRMWALVHDHVVGNAEHLLSSAVFFRDVGALTGRRRTQILELRDQLDSALRQLIHEGQTTGRIRDDVDADVAAPGILTMCDALYHWYRPDGTLSASDVATKYADLAVGGVAARTSYVSKARDAALAHLGAERAVAADMP